MIKNLVLVSYTYFDGTVIGDMLSQWDQAGFFQYLLPFLLIFALVFGILSQIKLFQNKSINGIIALVVGLLALQFPMVSQFFAEIFPRLGIALSIILVVMIILGLFLNSEKDSDPTKWILLGVAGIILIIVLVKTAGALGWSTGWWWQDNWPMIAGVVFILAVIGIIVGGSSSKPSGKYTPFFMKD